ncbi:MAG: hypothetical protein WKG32_08875 [Gemmatimonadaceae bacterium]
MPKRPKPTRTLNPLHFEDLEPHRFEDMVRQLAYDFREWKSIEATGRLGADKGMDSRATEAVPGTVEPAADGAQEEDDALEASEAAGRVWVIQCRRQRSIGPTAARKIVRESIPDGGEPPYGFILAAACDFSVKTREALRSAIRDPRGGRAGIRGVGEGRARGQAHSTEERSLALRVFQHLASDPPPILED